MAPPPQSAEPYLPERRDLPALRDAVDGCRGCGLWERATQGVLGEGGRRGSLMLVGEQPGDQEDRIGRPFAGPAGRVLDDALAAAGIDRQDVYVTNAVKHFKWRARGQRRIHDRPSWTEIRACGPWLRAELEAVEPRVVVALGATAGQALLGREFRVLRDRGRVDEHSGRAVVATYHPSAVLRADDRARDAVYAELVADLELARRTLGEPAAGARRDHHDRGHDGDHARDHQEQRERGA